MPTESQGISLTSEINSSMCFGPSSSKRVSMELPPGRKFFCMRSGCDLLRSMPAALIFASPRTKTPSMAWENHSRSVMAAMVSDGRERFALSLEPEATMTRWAVVLLAALAVSGCGRRRVQTVAGPGMNTKREHTLLEQAAARLQCDRSTLIGAFEGSLETNYHAYRVDGCGKRFHALLHCTGICNWREAPEMRAETELGCPATQLTRQYTQGTHVFVITGCGRTVAYELGQGRLTPVQVVNSMPAPPAENAPSPPAQ